MTSGSSASLSAAASLDKRLKREEKRRRKEKKRKSRRRHRFSDDDDGSTSSSSAGRRRHKHHSKHHSEDDSSSSSKEVEEIPDDVEDDEELAAEAEAIINAIDSIPRGQTTPVEETPKESTEVEKFDLDAAQKLVEAHYVLLAQQVQALTDLTNSMQDFRKALEVYVPLASRKAISKRRRGAVSRAPSPAGKRSGVNAFTLYWAKLRESGKVPMTIAAQRWRELNKIERDGYVQKAKEIKEAQEVATPTKLNLS